MGATTKKVCPGNLSAYLAEWPLAETVLRQKEVKAAGTLCVLGIVSGLVAGLAMSWAFSEEILAHQAHVRVRQ